MNTFERRALYNLLRMNWLNDPTFKVESWQVEDYRTLPLFELFDRLKQQQIHLDRTSFVAFAEDCDSPEDLTEQLIGDHPLPPSEEDQIYLLIFELWRRLVSEKPSLSILCNELDHQIFLYDTDEMENPLALHDALIHFEQILDENVDEGIPPEQALKLISAYCAHDIETFLYDFISQQIDEDNESYAHELLDEFGVYFNENKWFLLLRLRLSHHSQGKTAQKLIQTIIEEHLDDLDIDFNLEFLSFLTKSVEPSVFHLLIQKTWPLIQSEEDFQDLLSIVVDYYQRLDQDSMADAFKALIEKRAGKPLEAPFNKADPDLIAAAHLFDQ